MHPGGADPEPQRLLRSAVHGVETADFRRVLDRSSAGVTAALGATEFRRLTRLFVSVANAQWALARGAVPAARQHLGAAVLRLPDVYRLPEQRDGVPRVALRALRGDCGGELTEAVAVARVAQIAWSLQREVDFLYRRATAIEPREALVEATTQEASWTIFDTHFLLAVRERRATGFPVPPTRQRKALCARATQIVRLGRPAAGPVSEKVWRTAGGYDGLFAEALAELAVSRSPAPWHDAPGAECVPVRLGRQRLWEFAQERRNDRIAWT